jgi:hypothetical protein
MIVQHCEHVWTAVSCSVKLFPNLEAALKGVFNRVLTFLLLDSNNIFPEGAIAIAEALKVNAVLTNRNLCLETITRSVRWVLRRSLRR